jgi:hypothetical protein
MTRNPLEKLGELSKVIGLKRDIESDEISVDVKVNYCIARNRSWLYSSSVVRRSPVVSMLDC